MLLLGLGDLGSGGHGGALRMASSTVDSMPGIAGRMGATILHPAVFSLVPAPAPWQHPWARSKENPTPTSPAPRQRSISSSLSPLCPVTLAVPASTRNRATLDPNCSRVRNRSQKNNPRDLQPSSELRGELAQPRPWGKKGISVAEK